MSLQSSDQRQPPGNVCVARETLETGLVLLEHRSSLFITGEQVLALSNCGSSFLGLLGIPFIPVNRRMQLLEKG